jgi:hypothetical protein
VKFPWPKKSVVIPAPPGPGSVLGAKWVETLPVKKPRKKRKAQTCFGRVQKEGHWFEHRADGIYIRRRYSRKWHKIGHDFLLDHVLGQLRLTPPPFNL